VETPSIYLKLRLDDRFYGSSRALKIQYCNAKLARYNKSSFVNSSLPGPLLWPYSTTMIACLTRDFSKAKLIIKQWTLAHTTRRKIPVYTRARFAIICERKPTSLVRELQGPSSIGTLPQSPWIHTLLHIYTTKQTHTQSQAVNSELVLIAWVTVCPSLVNYKLTKAINRRQEKPGQHYQPSSSGPNLDTITQWVLVISITLKYLTKI